MSTYHRANSLGAGTYGSVLAVYNDEGEEYALKLFLDDSDDDSDDECEHPCLDLGAVREISALRLLRGENSHDNIVPMVDVKSAEMDDGEEEYGAGTSGCLGMAMPLYPSGTLGDAIDNGLLKNRHAKVAVAHGLLSAVAYLHDNGIIHRDIKADNVMLQPATDPETWEPVLIDFSLAKIVNAAMYGMAAECFKEEGSHVEATHTGEVGTVTYQAPEVVASKPYGLVSDLWSVGVLLLEMIRNQTLPTSRNKQAGRLIEEAKQELPDQPFANLVRGLLTVDPDKRLTAREALMSPLFQKYNMDVPRVRIITVSMALPFDGEENEENYNANNVVKGNKKKKKNPVLLKRQKTIQRLCKELGCTHPMTKNAALAYSQQMYQLDDTLDDIKESQSLLDCVVLASKFFETELTDLSSLEEEGTKSFSNWSLETYSDNEATIWMLMDHCLYPRVLVEWDE